MSKQAKDGGPAFPAERFEDTTLMSGRSTQIKVQFPGMSLRDYFAAAALTGHLATLNPGSWGDDQSLAEDAAKGAYLVADAMLAERAK